MLPFVKNLSFLLEKNFNVDSERLVGSKNNNNLRILGLFFFCFFLLSILATRLWYLQVYKYDHFKQRSEENRLRIIPISPNRGLIFDRNGKVLVDNRTSYSVLIYPVKITPELEKKVELLSKKLEIKAKDVIQKLKYAGPNSPYPIDIKHDIDQDTISYLLENRLILPALTIEHTISRVHPEKSLASHILGYTGEITYDELKDLKEKDYKVGNNIGKTGIERSFEDTLRGVEGGHFIEVDSIGRKMRTLKTELPTQGNNLHLTIDKDLQRRVEELLEGKKAAAVVMDVNTGEILAMASKPDFDPNIFYSRISSKQWGEIQKLDNPFLNRAISSYTPGSIFKIVTTAAALQMNLSTEYRQFYSKGYFNIGKYRFGDWNPNGFGWVNLDKAMAYSIDTVYYELSLEMGINEMKRYANMFSVGVKTGVDLPGETKGIMPDHAWKMKYWKMPWFPGDSVNSSIGQGFIHMSPLQAAVMTAATANGGKVLKPRVLKSINSKAATDKIQVLRRIKVSKHNLDVVKKGMRSAVTYGTASALKRLPIEIAAKTGSAEDPPNKKTHGWVVSYAPYVNPKYTVVVFWQNGGHGGDVAAPIARDIYKYLYKDPIAKVEQPKKK